MPFIEINVTVPKRIINVEGVKQAIIDAQNRKTKPALVGLFHQTTEGWHHPPYFSSRRHDTSNQLGIKVYPDGEWAPKYAMLNEGARAHVIRPRRARMLRFQTGYRAGTRPRVLSSRPYQRFGDRISVGIVHHPGFEAREFTQTIATEYDPTFQEDMQDAIRAGAH